ncbi:Putative biotin-protein ligase [Septoria linicola]|uniref:Biotin-protein ligase n=1 Tax=Septoria linicola TaxID=215465 RepID=A0A9Q9EM01_9PEZI|nr:putative biotin-protein ligase [Septoria linicola]USW54992.1 Putative biotin-protein ligase [Septoria linicola]
MSSKRINVLIYSGPSTSLPSVRHATWTLRRLLGPNYAVHTLSADQLLKEPWPSTCALLVIPGGADMGYCRSLNGAGNRRIKVYVQGGGKYFGLCAGGYYGSAKCEFELGRKGWEVNGERELAFYPGACRGLALKGFVYGSEKGARSVRLSSANGSFNSYYNGGGVFVNAETLADKGVEVLASYDEELAVESGAVKAAVVYCKAGEGAAVLTGPHPEFAGTNLNRNEPTNPDYSTIVDALLATDQQRTVFLKTCLSKLGLEVSQEAQPVPSLSPIHLTAMKPAMINDLLATWAQEGIVVNEEGHAVIRGENDTFRLPHNAIFETQQGSKPSETSNAADVVGSDDVGSYADGATDRIPDYNAADKILIAHTQAQPDIKTTPHFKHCEFYHWLDSYRTKNGGGIVGDFGRVLLYGEVVTSTQTILEKNVTLLSQLPIGATAVATTQVSGRGRGTNVWVSPPGSMMFSTTFRHPLALSTTAPVVFVQYIAAMAIVAGIQTYDRGYDKLPIKLKWPNDVYALDPNTKKNASDPTAYVKIGGILVNSSYAGGDYTLIVGIGLNLANAAPTTSINDLAAKAGLPPLSYERLLGSILVNFESLYARFCRSGFNAMFEKSYYSSWLHTEQIVTLEAEGGARARIKGITTDWGLLVAEELGENDRRTGRLWELQSDSNSFDFFRGLLKKKV